MMGLYHRRIDVIRRDLDAWVLIRETLDSIDAGDCSEKEDCVTVEGRRVSPAMVCEIVDGFRWKLQTELAEAEKRKLVTWTETKTRRAVAP